MNLPNGSRPGMVFVSGHATAPSTTLTSVISTMTSGDSNNIMYFPSPHRAWIIDAWSKNQTAGIALLTSPKFGDPIMGYRWRGLTGDPYQYWGQQQMQEVFPQDPINPQISGSATGGQFEFIGFTTYYSMLPGSQQNLINSRQLSMYRKYDYTVEHSIVGGTAAGYTEVALNGGTVYNLRANTYYAITGMMINTGCFAVTYRGPDLGNQRIAIPGNSTNKEVTRDYFVWKSDILGLPGIPVFNSANGGPTTVGVLCDQAGGTFIVTTQLVMLDDAIGRVLVS